jgi:hypothetical protein
MPDLLNAAFRPLFVGTVIVQGTHLVEHIIQLIQVYVFRIPDDEALGLLGYVFQFQGTEEWLHLAFNATYLTALALLVLPLRRMVPQTVAPWAFAVFGAGVALEGWHNVEHAVIISNVIANGGCPCPGIVDAALGVSDTVLHFFYNLVAYLSILPPLWYLTHSRSSSARPVELAEAAARADTLRRPL